MPAAPATPAAPTAQPARSPTEPSRICRVITIVRWLISFGTILTTAVREQRAEPPARSIAWWFNTPDPGLILRRLTRGLMRAAALEAWLRERAAKGHELPHSSPLRPPSSGKPRSSGLAGDARPRPWWQDLDHVPTLEEAAAEVRRRPPGAVIVDVCEDLHVLDTVLDRLTWHELKDAIIRYNGSLARLWIRDWRRCCDPARFSESCAEDPPPPWQAPSFWGLMPAAAHPP